MKSETSNSHDTHDIEAVLSMIPIIGILGVVFSVLKFCYVIDWSWWLVLLPLYAPLTVGLFFIFFYSGILGFLNTKFFIKKNSR